MFDKIKINIGNIARLADLVFLGEMVVNGERELDGTEVEEYAELKDEIIEIYKLTLTKAERKELAERDDINNHFMERLCGYIERYDLGSLRFALSELLAKVNKKCNIPVKPPERTPRPRRGILF